MKQIDLSQTVMDKVVRFETRRVKLWIAWFLLVLITLGGAFVVVSWLIAQDIIQQQTLDLLDVFTNDFEIIAQEWQDNLIVFWEELPHKALTIAAVIAFIVILLIIVTRNKRRLIKKKIVQLAKYRQKR